jgi:soluble cytochrome b562
MSQLEVPHAFQQQLSYETTPTLCDAIPSYKAMTQVWKDQQEEEPEMADIIQEGLDKLETYIDRTELVPAYVLAMGAHLVLFYLH